MESLELEGGCPQLPASPHRGHCPQVGMVKKMEEGLEKDEKGGLLYLPLLGEGRPQCISEHCQDQQGLCLGVQWWQWRPASRWAERWELWW